MRREQKRQRIKQRHRLDELERTNWERQRDASKRGTAHAPWRDGGGGGGGGRQGLTPRAADYSLWYQEVIQAAELADQSPVKGCMVIRPTGMALWDALRSALDERIKESGAQNAYFPLFIPVSFLSKEAEHVEGFAKECAVVTHHRLRSTEGGKAVEPDPDAELEEPLIVRPTSETMIWHMFQKWIMSYRDLPLKVNQWANVVRWELRTRPFLRSAEFLWQEGHTAHATREEAVETARQMLDVYADVCRDVLAMPVVKGVKSPTERFAGADDTFTIEALMQNGWALQSGTSHFLGQNFAKAFDVTFSDDANQQQHVWATSWGVSTRLVGALIMSHSDDSGLVLPPAVAPTQAVVVPISPGPDKQPEQHAELMAFVDAQVASMRAAGVRVSIDTRWNVRPGPKFFEYERKGVPLRIEAGPRDMAAGKLVVARRTGGDKFDLPAGEAVGGAIAAELDAMQGALLAAAEARLSDGTRETDSYAEMVDALAAAEGAGSGGAGLFLVPWFDDAAAEKSIKDETKATIRCFPLGEQHRAEGRVCFYSGKPATHMALFGRAF
mmetsp:Transcript_8927/g.29624  ORF Transcript_8927/g.29624 Transcript_8927/m.29624 type:complete len:555 (-) Transcript_8927:146-1810(-)